MIQIHFYQHNPKTRHFFVCCIYPGTVNRLNLIYPNAMATPWETPNTIFYAPFQSRHGQQAESKISEAKAKFYFDLREVKCL